MLKKTATALSLLLLSLSLTACNSATPETEKEIPPPTTEVTTDTVSYTMEEVAKHNTKESCWTVIDGNIYDITSAIDTHKGGEAILKGCGVDGTELFSKHPETAKENLKNFLLHALE